MFLFVCLTFLYKCHRCKLSLPSCHRDSPCHPHRPGSWSKTGVHSKLAWRGKAPSYLCASITGHRTGAPVSPVLPSALNDSKGYRFGTRKKTSLTRASFASAHQELRFVPNAVTAVAALGASPASCLKEISQAAFLSTIYRYLKTTNQYSSV